MLVQIQFFVKCNVDSKKIKIRVRNIDPFQQNSNTNQKNTFFAAWNVRICIAFCLQNNYRKISKSKLKFPCSKIDQIHSMFSDETM